MIEIKKPKSIWWELINYSWKLALLLAILWVPLYFFVDAVYQFRHGSRSPHIQGFWDSGWAYSLVCGLIVAFFAGRTIVMGIKFSWYPFLFGSHKYFFISTEKNTLIDIRIEDSRWEVLKLSDLYFEAKFTKYGRYSRNFRFDDEENEIFGSLVLKVSLFKGVTRNYAVVCFEYEGKRIKSLPIHDRVDGKFFRVSSKFIEKVLSPISYHDHQWRIIDMNSRGKIIDHQVPVDAPKIVFE